MKKIPNRKSIRLANYDYSQEGSYFITLCTHRKQHIFGEIRNGIMGLNPLGLIAYEEWQKTALIRPQVSLGACMIMPNHMHGIIHIDEKIPCKIEPGKFQSPSQTVGAIVRGYKSAATTRMKALLREDSSLSSTDEWLFAPTIEKVLKNKIDLSKSIWQRNYYEHIIRHSVSYQIISNYIWNNPMQWTVDKFYKK